jgi:hypothetical protein
MKTVVFNFITSQGREDSKCHTLKGMLIDGYTVEDIVLILEGTHEMIIHRLSAVSLQSYNSKGGN